MVENGKSVRDRALPIIASRMGVAQSQLSDDMVIGIHFEAVTHPLMEEFLMGVHSNMGTKVGELIARIEKDFAKKQRLHSRFNGLFA